MVEDETELLSGVAHGISTIGTRCGAVELLVQGLTRFSSPLEGTRWEYVLVLNTCTGIRVSTADVAEHVTVSFLLDAGLDGTAQRVEHAAAELLVGRWGKRRSLGLPVGCNCRAGSNGVRRSVGSAVDTGRRDGGHGLAQVALHEMLAVSCNVGPGLSYIITQR